MLVESRSESAAFVDRRARFASLEMEARFGGDEVCRGAFPYPTNTDAVEKDRETGVNVDTVQSFCGCICLF